MGNSKAENQRRHARQRARERFGLELDEHQLRAVVNRIQRGESRFLEKQSNRVSLHQVEYMGAEMVVVYDRRRKNVVTVWPSEDQGSD